MTMTIRRISGGDGRQTETSALQGRPALQEGRQLLDGERAK
jgi:hypothetical protein